MTPEQLAYWNAAPPRDMGELDAAPRDFGELDAGPVRDMGEIDAGAPVGTPSWDAEAGAPPAPTALSVAREAPPPPADYYGPPPPVRDMGELDAPPAPEGAIGFQIPAGARAAAATANVAPKPAGPSGPAKPSEASALNKTLLGTYDTEKEATRDVGQSEQMRADLLAQRGYELAQEKQAQQEAAAVEAADRAARLKQYQEETQRQIDDVRSQTIQPNRAYSDGGSAALAVFGGVLGGLYQGLNKLQSNPFIDQMNKVIDRDIAAQEHDLATKRSGILDRKSLLADMRDTYKDEALAKAQAKNLYFEAAKEKLQAEAATYDSPIVKARVDMAVAGLTRAQTQLRLDQMAKEAAARAQAAAAKNAQIQKDFDNRLAAAKQHNENRKTDIEQQKADQEAGKKDEAQTAALAKEMADPKLVNARKTIDDIKKKVMRGTNPETGAAEYDNKTRIPGTGQGAETREALFPGQPPLAANLIPGYGAAHYVGKLSDEERIGKLEWSRLFDAYRVEVTGAGAGTEELDRLKKSFQGSNTAAEQQAAIRLADEMLSSRESRIKAGVNPEVARKYDARVNQEQGARPAPVRREPVK